MKAAAGQSTSSSTGRGSAFAKMDAHSPPRVAALHSPRVPHTPVLRMGSCLSLLSELSVLCALCVKFFLLSSFFFLLSSFFFLLSFFFFLLSSFFFLFSFL